MMRFWSARWVRGLLLIVVAFPISVFIACWYSRIWSFDDYHLYQEVQQYSMGSDLWFGRIQAGDDADDLLNRFPAHRSIKFGRWHLIGYHPGGPPQPGFLYFDSLGFVAKDGKIVSADAGSCTWNRVFFEMGSEDQAEYTEAYRRYAAERDKNDGP